ncbi:MAG: putative ABC transporter permease [Ruthenibacterium sp.]
MHTLFFAQPYAWYDALNAFFLYSFLGWCMECVVIRREKGAWENRGFVHSPFCIIYGFGAMLGYVLLKPFSGNYLFLYLAGVVLATTFEYLTARLMLRVFGALWWDYSEKPFNYKGILCLESSIGWGVIAVLLFAVMQRTVLLTVRLIPPRIALLMSLLLLCGYALDFALSVRAAYQHRTGESSAASTVHAER